MYFYDIDGLNMKNTLNKVNSAYIDQYYNTMDICFMSPIDTCYSIEELDLKSGIEPELHDPESKQNHSILNQPMWPNH